MRCNTFHGRERGPVVMDNKFVSQPPSPPIGGMSGPVEPHGKLYAPSHWQRNHDDRYEEDEVRRPVEGKRPEKDKRNKEKRKHRNGWHKGFLPPEEAEREEAQPLVVADRDNIAELRKRCCRRDSAASSSPAPPTRSRWELTDKDFEEKGEVALMGTNQMEPDLAHTRSAMVPSAPSPMVKPAGHRSLPSPPRIEELRARRAAGPIMVRPRSPSPSLSASPPPSPRPDQALDEPTSDMAHGASVRAPAHQLLNGISFRSSPPSCQPAFGPAQPASPGTVPAASFSTVPLPGAVSKSSTFIPVKGPCYPKRPLPQPGVVRFPPYRAPTPFFLADMPAMKVDKVFRQAVRQLLTDIATGKPCSVDYIISKVNEEEAQAMS